jgi:hypothetical protein
MSLVRYRYVLSRVRNRDVTDFFKAFHGARSNKSDEVRIDVSYNLKLRKKEIRLKIFTGITQPTPYLSRRPLLSSSSYVKLSFAGGHHFCSHHFRGRNHRPGPFSTYCNVVCTHILFFSVSLTSTLRGSKRMEY